MKVDIEKVIEELKMGGYDIISYKGISLRPEFIRNLSCCKNVLFEDMTAKEYVHSDYFVQFRKRILEECKCEGCGNKPTRISLTNWNNRGHETLDDIIVLCSQCEVIDGQIVSYKELKKELKKEIKVDESMKEMVKEALKDIVASNAMKALLGEK